MNVRSKYALGLALAVLLLFVQGCGSNGAAPADQGSASSAQASQPGKKAKVTVGYQSPTAQTWGALIVKHNKLFEKHLAITAPDDDVQVEWFDAPAGSVLNNQMNGGKIQISFLGDMPSLLNGVLGVTQPNYDSVFLAFDGKGQLGRNQAIMVPLNSDISSVEDLEGKTVSTPIGSSSHRMLLETLRKHGLVDKVTIVDQSVAVGMQSIEQGKVAAHATWEPYPSLIQQKKYGSVLAAGEETRIDYLAGVVANLDWAKDNRAYVVAFLQALHEAHQYARTNPEETAEIFAEESQFPIEICRKMVENIRFDAAIYDKDLSTLQGSIDFLTQIGKLKSTLDLAQFVDDDYLREAVGASGSQPYPTDKELEGEWIPDNVY
ncbi:ABC transporter substrate-binding protein [Paenibacillus aurantiacus]|uniref:ABC transporter substrate-binding protein n=1 Tax=Paenibacillus aurantiacus TaxID=1936118 RepID=A0ABV5KHB3_9BACL